MSIDEAIKHCLEVADGHTEQGRCPECAMEHRQLAEWLTDYKRLKERESCDAISRQAVFAALEKVAGLFPWRIPGKLDTYDSYNGTWNDAIGRAEMEIEGLPPVNPQKNHKSEARRWKRRYLKLRQQTRWIPVSERLPEAGEYVGDVEKYYLVQNEYGDILVAKYTHSEYWEQIYELRAVGDEIVAWMPLPAPYDPQESEVNNG